MSHSECLAHWVQSVCEVCVWGASLPVWPRAIAVWMTLLWTVAVSDQSEMPLRVTQSSPSLIMLICMQSFYFQVDFLWPWVRGSWAACQHGGGLQRVCAPEASGPQGCPEAGMGRAQGHHGRGGGVKCRQGACFTGDDSCSLLSAGMRRSLELFSLLQM